MWYNVFMMIRNGLLKKNTGKKKQRLTQIYRRIQETRELYHLPMGYRPPETPYTDNYARHMGFKRFIRVYLRITRVLNASYGFTYASYGFRILHTDRGSVQNPCGGHECSFNGYKYPYHAQTCPADGGNCSHYAYNCSYAGVSYPFDAQNSAGIKPIPAKHPTGSIQLQ